MTTQDFYQSACYAFGQDPTNVRFSDDFYKSLGFSQNDFCSRRRWGFLRTSGDVTTEEDVRTVDLPDDFGMLYDFDGAVRLTDADGDVDDSLTIITHQQYLQHHYDSDESGTPNYCWLLGTTISFSPIPDAAYTVTLIYYKRPTAISGAQSAMTVPADYHEAIQQMVYRRLQVLGYSSINEVAISETELNRLISQFARDDIGKYGGMTVNLPPSNITIETT